LAYLNSYFQTGIENSLDDAVKEFREFDLSSVKKVDEIPFDFIRKRLSVVVSEAGKVFMAVKGAPEEIFSCAEKYSTNGSGPESLTEEIKARAFEVYESLSASGFRVLAIAEKLLGEEKVSYSQESEKDLILCGFICFLDPPKKGVKESIDRLEEAGIEVKVITGDNELVAKKICSEIGVEVRGVMTERDLRGLDDYALRRRAEKTTIFARFSPEEKNRVISVLRANNHVVGYLGDGINDAPSLKTADVGLSVNNAVDVAKESADIILTNKSLDILSDGVLEGRKVFGNTMKYIMMGLSSNFGNMFSAAGAVMFLPFLPMKPLQILLNNFIYDISQITIPADNVDKEWIEKPRRWDMKFIKRFMFIFGPVSSFFDFLTFFVLFYGFKLSESAFQTGWFLESLATQVLVIHIIRTRKIPFLQSRPANYLVYSTFGAVAFAWILPFTPLASFFGLVPLSLNILWALLIIIAVYLCIVEIAKRYFFRRHMM
jgi:P-type Mg2+ transporter